MSYSWEVLVKSCSKLLRGRPRGLALLAGVTVTYWWLLVCLLGAQTISYVQCNYAAPQTAQTTVSVTYTAAQAAGDLNVIAVGWNDGVAAVNTVTDRSGNIYTRVVGPTSSSGTVSQSIYYAKNTVAAAAGTNTVTVTFSTAATNPDIRILEYSGADPNNPVDVSAAASGNTNSSSSGAVTTTNPTDLLFGANMVYTLATSPGNGFTERLLTSPDGDLAEDRMVSVAGSYAATAPLNQAGPWVMQMVAFRTPSGATPLPTVTSVSPNTGSAAGGTAVTITGTNFAAGATVTFGAAAAANVTLVNGTTITATSPAGTTGQVAVTVTNPGAQSGSLANGFTYGASSGDSSGTLSGGASTTITYVQGNSATPQTAQTSVPVTFTSAQNAGDLNVVAVGWTNGPATVGSVTDRSGNIYTLAVGPTVQNGFASQSIYYAKNIAAAAAGANIVTVAFSSAASTPDIRILEYSGADPNNPVDTKSANMGTSSTSSSGSATTTNSTDLIFGANMLGNAAGPGHGSGRTFTTNPGAGFTSRMITSPDGDIAEDKMVTTGGSVSASASLGSWGPWIMQMVAFRTPSGGTIRSRGEQCIAEKRADGGRDGSYDHRGELSNGRDSYIWCSCRDQCCGGERYNHPGHNSSRNRRCCDGDGNHQWAECKSDEWIHLYRCPDGERCIAEQRIDRGRDRGHHHGD